MTDDVGTIKEGLDSAEGFLFQYLGAHEAPFEPDEIKHALRRIGDVREALTRLEQVESRLGDLTKELTGTRSLDTTEAFETIGAWQAETTRLEQEVKTALDGMQAAWDDTNAAEARVARLEQERDELRGQMALFEALDANDLLDRLQATFDAWASDVRTALSQPNTSTTEPD